MNRPRLVRWWALAALAAAPAGCDHGEPVEEPIPLVEAPPFEYPAELWADGVEGETVLLLHVTAQGAVDSTRVDRSSGSAVLDSAAVAGVAELRFTPARQGDRPVSTWVRLPVRFERDTAAVNAAYPPVRTEEQP